MKRMNAAVRRRTWRWATCVAAMVLIAAAFATGVSACGFPNRRGAANAISDTIRTLPGVSAADVRYRTSIDSGAHFDLDVTLADTATDTQARAVGRTFVDRVRAADFAEFDVTLAVAYRVPSDFIPSALGSRANFEYHFDAVPHGGPASTDVADSLALWLQVAQSPAAAAVLLGQPAWGGPANSKDITVVLAASVDDPVIADLIHAHPELSTATWQVNIPPANRFAQPRRYTVRGRFPEQRLRGRWQQIVDQIGSDDEAEAATDTIDTHAGVAPNRVEISVESGSDEQQRFEHLARAVTPLLPGLGLPVHLRLLAPADQIEFTLGGCDPPDPAHTPSPLESELRQQYQSC